MQYNFMYMVFLMKPGHNDANASVLTYIIFHSITLLTRIVLGVFGTNTFSYFLEF